MIESMIDRLHAYSAKWLLIPELSFYEEGQPPASGTYQISVEDDAASFSITWTTVEGQELSVEFAGLLDGQLHDVEQPEGAQASYTRIDNQTLDSTMVMNGVEVAYARRIVSNDGELMSVLQTSVRPDGSSFRNTQVYRKEHD